MKVPVTVVKDAVAAFEPMPEQVTFEGRPGEALPSRIILLRDAENQPVLVHR